MGFVGGIIEECELSWSSPLVWLGMCEWERDEVSRGVNVGEFGSASGVWGLGMVVPVVGLRAWLAGDGFQALHWNMLNWSEFGRCTRVLRVFCRGWVVTAVIGVGCWV